MRYILAGLFILVLVQPSYGQDEVVPDTLSWQGYYPLEVGNTWEWETQILVAYSGQDQREIIADTLINGHTYFVQAAYFFRQDPLHGIDSSGRDTTYLRYDTLRTRVVELQENGKEQDYTCDLSLDFGTMTSCDLFGPETYVDGAYAGEGDVLLVEGDPVPFNGVKAYYNLGGGINYYHGIGMLPGVGDGAAGSISFNYLRLGGKEYGERVVFVGVEEEEVPDAHTVAVYPNPARDQVTVDLGSAESRISLFVYNVLGQTVLSKQDCTGASCVIDTSSLSSGIYLIRGLKEDGTTFQTHFMIVR